jgi:hypothetical protein
MIIALRFPTSEDADTFSNQLVGSGDNWIKILAPRYP